MGDPVTFIAQWLENLLLGWGLTPQWVTILMTIIGVAAIAIFVLLVDIFLVWVERKVVARFQDRLGPNRLGPFGLIQPIADVIKLLIKEDITPIGADRFVYNLPPIIALATVLMLWAVIPLAPTIVGTDLDVGVLYVVALGALGTLGIIMAGWASNNKYALVGAFRTVAQMVSYEVPMVIALMVPVLLAGTMGINSIVFAQSPVWYVVVAPVAALIIFISAIAELGRAPFDLTEAESEIVAGFHIEYTGMKFGMFYAGELLHALTILKGKGRRFSLTIAGDGPERGKLEALARTLNLSTDTTFLGMKTKDEISVLMKQADILSLTSMWENQPVVVLEALASGLPVLAPSIGGIPEIVLPGCGRLFDPGNIQSIVTEMEQLLDNLQDYRSDNIAEYAHNKFSYTAVGQAYSLAYHQVMEEHKR